MKKLLIIMLVLLMAVSCNTVRTVEVPVETVRTEYIIKTDIQHDSIFVKDSIDRYTRNDTVFIEKYRYGYKYKDRIFTDTVCKTDSIQVPVYIDKVTEVNRLKGYQKFLMYSGILLIVLALYKVYKLIRKIIK